MKLLILGVLFTISHLAHAEWSEWSACSASCGEGVKSRFRSCGADEFECNIGEKITHNSECTKKPCGALRCWNGIQSKSSNLEIVNTFKLTPCDQIPNVPVSKNGRNGMQCSMAKFKVFFAGMEVDVLQGSCITNEMCPPTGITCKDYANMLVDYDFDTCELQCCLEDGCNNPENIAIAPVQPDPESKCSSSPCRNGGKCIEVSYESTEDDYFCVCSNTYRGKNCNEAASRVCYTGVNQRSNKLGENQTMSVISCQGADDVCMLATVGVTMHGIKTYVETAQCRPRDVCSLTTCEALKKSMNIDYFSSCNVTCCETDMCNKATRELPPDTTIATTTTKAPTTIKQKPTTKPKPKTTKPTSAKTTLSTTASTASTIATGEWSEWQAWQTCTHSCGNDGTRQRFRYCKVNPCSGENYEKEKCNVGLPCAYWSEYGSWLQCSRSCGGGSKTRMRHCNGGSPGSFGCEGEQIEQAPCNEHPCAKSTTTTTTQSTTTPTTQPAARWSNWSQYGDCSVTCGFGKRTRTRLCLNGNIGQPGCKGFKQQKQSCAMGTCPSHSTTTACPKRNTFAAKKEGKKCKPMCKTNKKCKKGKKCLCDGNCGKVCQLPAGDASGESTSTIKTPTGSCPRKATSHNKCCGNLSYLGSKAACCNNKVSPRGRLSTSCCGTKPYNPKVYGCCANKIFYIKNKECKNGSVVDKS